MLEFKIFVRSERNIQVALKLYERVKHLLVTYRYYFETLY